jgi:hypothetical protein
MGIDGVPDSDRGCQRGLPEPAGAAVIAAGAKPLKMIKTIS